MRQAVSDLSAENAPSRQLWSQLAALSEICEPVSITIVCIYIQGKLTKTLRIGIYLFAVMEWISRVGYKMFPLSSSGYSGTFQDIVHVYVLTVLVVLLSIVSLLIIIVGGFKKSMYPSLAACSLAALLLMIMGAIGTGVLPLKYFGIPERFSVFAASGFNAVLGVKLFKGFSS